MPRPRFVLAGVPKAGTTSLYRYLHAQPGVYVSDVKEINFLSYPGATLAKERYPWLHFPVTTVDAYDALFADAGNRVPIDVSPSCFRSEVSIARMQQFLHEPGILLLLRDPVERAWSAYQDQVRKGYEHRPPDTALVPGERMVELGFYAERVGAFQRAFGADRVGVWLLDDLRADATATVRDICSFVGATEFHALDLSTVHNKGTRPRNGFVHRLVPSYATRRRIRAQVPNALLRPAEWAWRRNQVPSEPIPAALAARLRTLYADDVARLESLIDRDLQAWREPATADGVHRYP